MSHQRTQVFRLYPKPWQGARLNITAVSGQERLSPCPGGLGLHLFLLGAKRRFPYGINQTARLPHDGVSREPKKKRERLRWIIRHGSVW